MNEVAGRPTFTPLITQSTRQAGAAADGYQLVNVFSFVIVSE